MYLVGPSNTPPLLSGAKNAEPQTRIHSRMALATLPRELLLRMLLQVDLETALLVGCTNMELSECCRVHLAQRASGPFTLADAVGQLRRTCNRPCSNSIDLFGEADLLDVGLEVLAKRHALEHVVSVNLTRNGITVRGVAAVMAAWQHGWSSLEFLNLSHNPLGDAGLCALADGLRRRGTTYPLRELRLHHVARYISDQLEPKPPVAGAQALLLAFQWTMEALPANGAPLDLLDLGSNLLPEELHREVVECAEQCVWGERDHECDGWVDD
jgi:hypothetical protein